MSVIGALCRSSVPCVRHSRACGNLLRTSLDSRVRGNDGRWAGFAAYDALLSREFTRGAYELVELRPGGTGIDGLAGAVDAVGDVLGDAGHVQRGAGIEGDDLARQALAALDRIEHHRLRLRRAGHG